MPLEAAAPATSGPIDGTYKHVEWAVSVRPAFTATSLCPSSSSSLSSSGSATSKRSGISPGKSRRQKLSIEAGNSCSRLALTISGVATAFARRKRCQAEEMIAVPVSDIDRGEVLAARDDPIQQRLRLPGRKKGVHENGVALTADEYRRIRHPHQLFLAGGQIASKARALYRQYVPFEILVSAF